MKIYKHRLTGQIPSSLGNLTELETVYLDSNYLWGPIPASLGNLTKLEELWLTNAGLTGEIPASLGNLRRMKSLQIGGGRLTGSIPASLGNLANLNDPGAGTAGIYLSGNYLTGCAPWGLRDHLGTDKINNQRDAAGNAVTLVACPPPPPELTQQPCETNGVTTLWLGYACYIKAGVAGVRSFEDMALQGNSATVAHLLERGGSGVGVTEVMPYNPLGGRATVKTTKEGTDDQNNTVVIELDTFAVDVIPFGIRDYSVSAPTAAVNSSFTLTARLNSPAHLSPDKYRKNGTDLARKLGAANAALRVRADGERPRARRWGFGPGSGGEPVRRLCNVHHQHGFADWNVRHRNQGVQPDARLRLSALRRPDVGRTALLRAAGGKRGHILPCAESGREHIGEVKLGI